MKFKVNIDIGRRNWLIHSDNVRDSGGTLTFDIRKIIGQDQWPMGSNTFIWHSFLINVTFSLCCLEDVANIRAEPTHRPVSAGVRELEWCLFACSGLGWCEDLVFCEETVWQIITGWKGSLICGNQKLQVWWQNRCCLIISPLWIVSKCVSPFFNLISHSVKASFMCSLF